MVILPSVRRDALPCYEATTICLLLKKMISRCALRSWIQCEYASRVSGCATMHPGTGVRHHELRGMVLGPQFRPAVSTATTRGRWA
jgi:hypothetical protein